MQIGRYITSYRHMGITVVDQSRGDIDKIIAALNKVIPEAKRPGNPQSHAA